MRDSLEVLKDCPWETRAKAFNDSLARAAHLATMTRNDDKEHQIKEHHESIKTLREEKTRVFKTIKHKRKLARQKFMEDSLCEEEESKQLIDIKPNKPRGKKKSNK